MEVLFAQELDFREVQKETFNKNSKNVSISKIDWTLKIGNFEKWESYKHPTSVYICQKLKKETVLNKHFTFEILSKDYLKWYWLFISQKVDTKLL